MVPEFHPQISFPYLTITQGDDPMKQSLPGLLATAALLIPLPGLAAIGATADQPTHSGTTPRVC
jgi:hypothetical protein